MGFKASTVKKLLLPERDVGVVCRGCIVFRLSGTWFFFRRFVTKERKINRSLSAPAIIGIERKRVY